MTKLDRTRSLYFLIAHTLDGMLIIVTSMTGNPVELPLGTHGEPQINNCAVHCEASHCLCGQEARNLNHS